MAANDYDGPYTGEQVDAALAKIVDKDLDIADGGTGASTQLAAQTSLGLLPGTDVAPQSHVTNTSNPHGVTAAQAGADPVGSASTVQGNLDTHEGNSANPHSVTKAQVGLTNVTDDTQVVAVTLTDNAIPKADGTAGQVQNSGVVINDVNAVSGAGLLSGEIVGTAYEFVLTDAGTLKVPTNAAAVLLTIPSNAAVSFPIDAVINVVADGAGQVSFAITDDTLDSKDGKVKLTGQYSAATLIKRSATRWILFGDLSA